jgi:hypothetical protein
MHDILAGLGIQYGLVDSFGITDVGEIRERQALVKFFVDNPQAVAFVER